MEVLLRAQVSYSELYGLSLTVDEIEPRFTLGAAELQRRKTLEKLAADGLLDRQQELEPALLPYRLAVISARDAAGYGDFRRHLEENAYGFVFEVELLKVYAETPAVDTAAVAPAAPEAAKPAAEAPAEAKEAPKAEPANGSTSSPTGAKKAATKGTKKPAAKK